MNRKQWLQDFLLRLTVSILYVLILVAVVHFFGIIAGFYVFVLDTRLELSRLKSNGGK